MPTYKVLCADEPFACIHVCMSVSHVYTHQVNGSELEADSPTTVTFMFVAIHLLSTQYVRQTWKHECRNLLVDGFQIFFIKDALV